MTNNDTNKYANGKVYKISDANGTEIYIGSTTLPLNNRLAIHKCSYKEWKAGKRRKINSFALFEKYGVENCVIELLEHVACNSKSELLLREAFFIKSIPCVNKCIPGRTKQEYRKDNIAKIRAYNNAKLCCSCGLTYTRKHAARHRNTKRHSKFLQSSAK